MTVHIVTGKLGAGKTLVAVSRMVDYLQRGAHVATNLNVDTKRLPARCKSPRITRVPDFPTASDLHALGIGNPLAAAHQAQTSDVDPFGSFQAKWDESQNGLLVLDEAGVLFNARSWNDKSRGDVVAWFLHARKLGWDVLLIVQDVSLLDKQLRVTMGELTVFCKRLDRISLPVVGPLVRMVGLQGRMPRVHIGVVVYGAGVGAAVVDRWVYRGTELLGLYDTAQKFTQAWAHPSFSLLDLRHKPKPPARPIGKLSARLAGMSPDAAWRLAKRYVEAPELPGFEPTVFA